MNKNKLSKQEKSIEQPNSSKIRELTSRMGISLHSYLINDRGEVIRVGKISDDEIVTERRSYNQDTDEYEWHKSSTYSAEENPYHPYDGISYLEKAYHKIDKPIEEFEKDVFDEVKDLSKYYCDDNNSESTSTELSFGLDKSILVNMKGGLEETKRKVEIMERVLTRKMNQLNDIKRSFETKIKRLEKVIWTIELYLGVHENIVQIQDGDKADYKIPITFYQQVLFMDEEVGDPSDDGLDFQNISEFDSWVLRDNNYMKLIPSERGVRVLQVRRYDKEYYSDRDIGSIMANLIMNQKNKMTYFLIRNGECFYRIWADIKVYDRLFPQKSEIEKLYKDKEEEVFDSYKERIDEKILSYKRNILIMQGLLERTDIFKPIPIGLNMMNPQTYNGLIQFVYDDELTLTEGRMYYEEWHKHINSKIVRGTRIYFTGYGYRDFQSYSGKVGRHNWEKFKRGNIHEIGSGIYNVIAVEKYDKDRERFLCYYNPGDTIYTRYEDHERKKSIGFYAYGYDDKVLNYDMMSLDDVDYYINSRLDRKNYLKMIPTLWGIKKRRIEELKWEKGFVEGLKLSMSYNDKDELEKIIWKCIDWWKNKVIWKRPIMKEDAKALRMITSKVKKIVLDKNTNL